MCVTAYWIHF